MPSLLRVLPLPKSSARVFHVVEIGKYRLQAPVAGADPIIECILPFAHGWVQIGPAFVHRHESTHQFAICKYRPSEPRIGLSGLDASQVEALAAEFGLPMSEHDHSNDRFFTSPAGLALCRWVAAHPMLGRKITASNYLGDWPARARMILDNARPDIGMATHASPVTTSPTPSTHALPSPPTRGAAFNPQSITQHVSVQVCRRLYLDAHGNVVHLMGEARLDDVLLAGLHPVLVYALIVEGVGFAYLRLAPWDAPLAIGAFLRSAWSGADGFGYCPSILKCGPRFFDALPCLATYCHDAGVELRITSPTDRSYNRNLHSAQSYVSDAAWYVDRPANGGAPVTLAAYETRILQNELHEPMPALSLAKRTARAQYHAAIKRPCPSPKAWPTVLDFDLGPWLFGNQERIPPRTRSAILSDAAVWLDAQRGIQTEQVWSDDLAFDDSPVFADLRQRGSDGSFAGNRVIAELLPCWIEPSSMVARRIGLSAKELQWYLNEQRGLDDEVIERAFQVFGIAANPDYCLDDGSPAYEARGNYVLIAPDKPGPVYALYDSLSHGGDIEFSVELVPQHGRADPSFRYLVFGYSYDVQVMVFQRGSRSAAALDQYGERADLINCAGPHAVPNRFYQVTVRLCAEVQRAPDRMFQMMRQFMEEHEKTLAELEQTFGRL